MADEAERWSQVFQEVTEQRKDRYVGFLSSLLRFDTVSGGHRDRLPRAEDPRFQDAWRFLRHECDLMGLDLRVYEGEAGIIEWTGTDSDAPMLGIATHLDVVPAEGDWTHPPFGGTVVDGQIWGRGAQDDKGPLAVVLSAIDAMQRAGLRPRRTIKILIGTFEETEDWPDMDRLLAREEIPKEVLVPDGAFPIGVGEKGIATIQWATDWVRHEAPGVLRFRGVDAGTRANVVPGRARVHFDTHRHFARDAEAVLEEAALRLRRIAPQTDLTIEGSDQEGGHRRDYVVSFEGRAAHAAIPHMGHNAALDALAYLTLLPGLPEPVQELSNFLYRNTRAIDGSGVGLERDHPQMGGTTLNLGRLEMDPAGAHAHLNVRFPVGTSAKDVEHAFRQAAAAMAHPRMHTEMMGRPQGAFLVEDGRHDHFIKPLAAAYETVTGEEAEALCIAGTTYAKLFPLAVGFGPVDLVRGEPVLVHQTDERVSVQRHLENIRIYALALTLLACPPPDQAEPDPRA